MRKKANYLTTAERIFNNLTINTELKQAGKAILESLLLAAEKTKELFTIELMNKVDNDINEKIPSYKLVNLKSMIDISIKNASFQEILDKVQFNLQPVLENSSCLVAKIIPRLFAYSLYLLFNELEDSSKTISRRYVFTDQIQIYKLEFKICAYKIPCPSLLPSINNVFCIVASQSLVDVNRIDFPSLAYFYQRQLTAHGIDEKALYYLFQELKTTYYMLKNPPTIFI